MATRDELKQKVQNIVKGTTVSKDFVGDESTVIRAPEAGEGPGLLERGISALPDSLEKSLFGNTDPRTGRRTGGFIPFVATEGMQRAASQERSFDTQRQRLIDNGFASDKASEIAGQYVTGQDVPEEAQSTLRTGRAVDLGFAALEIPFGIAGLASSGGKRVFRNIVGREGEQQLAKSVDPSEVTNILRQSGANQVADNADAVAKILRATNPKQVARILDDTETQHVKDTELITRAKARKTTNTGAAKAQPALRATNQTTPEVTTPRRVTPETQPRRTAEELTTRKSATAQETRKNMRDRVRATLDEQEYIDREVIPNNRSMPASIGKPTAQAPSNTKFVPDRVVQIADPEGSGVRMFRIREQDFDEVKRLIDDGRTSDTPIAMNKEVGDGTFHITAKTPKAMLSRKNVSDGGFITASEINQISRNATQPPSTGRGATGPAGQPAADSAPAATRTASPEEQPVSLPPKTNSNSDILDSLSQSNPKQAQKASKEYTDYKKAVDKTINTNWNAIREKTQDAFIRMRKLQQEVADGKPVPDDINVDQAETLFHGRVNSAMENVGNEVRQIDASIVQAARTTNVSPDEFRTDVDSYLHALHAPERNAKLGDGAAGITDADASKTLQALRDTGRFAEVKAEADKLLNLNSRTLDIMLEGELIDEATHTLLRETYKNHVPLMRVMSDTDDMTQALSGKGFDVKSSGLQKAKGSDKEVANITNNIVQAVEQAIIRSEKNLVNLTTARWARENKDLGIITEVKPKAIGKQFDEKTPVLENLRDKPNIISFREGGKQKYLEVQDENLATALKGVNVENVPTMLRGVAYLTRLYGQLHTRFNYEFAFSNTIRDTQEMAVELASRSNMGFGSAGRAVTRVPQSQKAVTDFIFGRDTEGARLYKQMREDGGTTGGLGLSSRQDIDMEIQRIQKLHQSSPRKAAESMLRAVDKWNMIFEDGTRLAAYRSALDSGLSRKQAAVVAKESTINFNKKGTSGPLINGLWMFSNASIQGTTKVLRAMKKPKVAAAVTASMAVAIESANQWNDSVDPEWRDKVTKWDRSANLVIMFPTEGEDIDYMTIPVSWGLKPVKMTVEYMSDLTRGEIDVVDGAYGILTSVLTAYNPLAGDESPLRTLTPTVLKTPFEIGSNRAWHGNQIKPAYDINAPESSQYFSSLGNSLTGRAAINLTENLSNKGIVEVSPADVDYAFNQYIGGVGRSISKISGAVANIGSDDPLPANQRPVLSRFFKTRTQEQVYADMFYTKREQADKEKARERVLDKRRVQPIYEEVQILAEEGNTAEAQAIVDSLSEEDYEVYKKLRATDTRRQNVGEQIQQYNTVREVEELVNQGKREEAQRIVEQLSDEEYEAYQDAKSALGVEF